jgi:hypothetical protein
MAVVIESHELINKGYQSVINYGWKNDLLQNGVVGWTVTKQKHCPQIIIRQTHSGRELCRHIVKSLTLTTTQLPHETVSIQLKMMERGMAIKPLKTT